MRSSKAASKAIRLRARARGLRWRKTFLECLARTGNVNLRAQHAAIDPSTAHRHRQNDPQFAEQNRTGVS